MRPSLTVRALFLFQQQQEAGSTSGLNGLMVQFSQEIFNAICDRIGNGESLRRVCRDDGYPAAGTVCRWLAEDEGGKLREQYARARDSQADVYADEITDIADMASVEGVQVARLQIDARKWLAGKLAPKKYGERVTQELVGANDGPIQFEESPADKLRGRLDAIASRTTSSPAKE